MPATEPRRAARVLALAEAWGERGRETWIGHSIVRSRELNLATHTLALAAQQVMCTVPLLLAVSALLRHFHAGGAVGLLSDVLQLDAPSRAALATLFATRQSADLGALLVEVVVSLAFLTGLAATTQAMLEQVWQVQPSRGQRLWRQLAWVLASSPCLALAMLAGRYVHRWLSLGHGTTYLAALVEGLAALVFYWWTQHLLLGGLVGWRRLLPGAALSGVGIALATLASAWLVPGQIVEQVGFYGPIGAAMVLGLWLMAVTVVVVAAALAGAVLVERRENERGRV